MKKHALRFAVVLCAAHLIAGQMIEGLKLPLRRHANGKVEVFLTADRASFEGDIIAAEGDITVLLLAEDGATNGIARAREGRFNRADMTAFCPGVVSLEKGPVRIFGENLRWESEKSKATIETNAVLILQRGGRSIIQN